MPVSTPSTLSGLKATALRKIAWNAKYEIDSVRPSVLTQIPTQFKIIGMNEIIIEKPGVLLDISNIGIGQQGQSVRLAMRTPLRRAPQLGNAENMLGNEDESALFWVEVYYNEIKKAVKYNQWGYDFNDTEWLNYNAGYQKLLALFRAEYDDFRMQQALILSYAEELTRTPTSLAQQFNKNWVIPNLSEGSYPAYNITPLTITSPAPDADGYTSDNRTYGGAGTFVQNIASALLSASGTGAVPKAIANIDNLNQLHHYLVHYHLVEPIMLDGLPTYILKLATPTFSWMMNSANSGSLAENMDAKSDYKDPKRPEIIGEVGRIFKDILLVHDTRSPSLTVGGAAGAYTLDVGFLMPGNNDDRDNGAWSAVTGSTKYVFDLNVVLGNNALVRYRRDAIRSGLAETTEYERIKGEGEYRGEGIMLPRYDLDAAHRTAESQIYRGSCIWPVSRRPVNTIT